MHKPQLFAVCLVIFAFSTIWQAHSLDTSAWVEQLWFQDALPLSAYPAYNNWTEAGLRNTSSMAYYLCPSDTLEIVVRAYGTFNTPLIHGCCPINQRGCMAPGSDRVLGCCPEDMQCMIARGQASTNFWSGEHWSIDGIQGIYRFLGCANSRAQLCYDRICPPDGYVCCRRNFYTRVGECVPSANVTLPDLSLCGNPVTDTVPLGFAQYGSVPLQQFPWSNWTLYSEPNNTFAEALAINGTTQFPDVNPPIFLCNGTSAMCNIGEECGLAPVWAYYNASSLGGHDEEGAVFTQETYCCPDVGNDTLCVYPDPLEIEYFWGTLSGVPDNLWALAEPPGYVGCASVEREETCCGQSICSQGNRCCFGVVNVTLTASYQMQRNYTDNPNATEITVYNPELHFCCPNLLQCCFGDPTQQGAPVAYLDELLDLGESIDPADFAGYDVRRLYAFCGAEIDDQHCAIDKMRPPGWHKLKNPLL